MAEGAAHVIEDKKKNEGKEGANVLISPARACPK
jgi:hypothetical protein